ncbi:hypothetical protein F5878DRAFT_647647 [Lentinula raphanica]|uniref:Uncharacterized protein n=1 Tax=Lentinula raphanica TaxID=153919 RepID=A0AA38U2Z3_9AGAR|nr:hypothetical protein F5880DRAFT_1512475 [Lentinula raphanica]KAJ3831419.1 hypothetical protein F5878DRAFT_647647 [Lentinula raphanica]
MNDITPSPQNQQYGSLLNLLTLNPLHRKLTKDDLIYSGSHPISGEPLFSLEHTVANILWMAAVEASRKICAASNQFIPGISQGPYPRTISPSSLAEVGMTYPADIDFIHAFVDRSNPISYSASRTQTIINFYEFRKLLGRLVDWMTVCQYRSFKRKEAGMTSLWAWDATRAEYEIDYPGDTEEFSRSLGYQPYDPRSPAPIQGLQRFPATGEEEGLDSNGNALILHPTLSHYASHFPGFDAFSKVPLPEIYNCEDRNSCTAGLDKDFEMMCLDDY